MTIDEAIESLKEDKENALKKNDINRYNQIIKWLKELKEYRKNDDEML